MEQQYTPGPWYAGYAGDQIQVGTQERFVAMTLPCESDGATAEDEANARLIAAAPDLLAALDFVTRAARAEPSMAIYAAHLALAEAAIDKARGQ